MNLNEVKIKLEFEKVLARIKNYIYSEPALEKILSGQPFSGMCAGSRGGFSSDGQHGARTF